MKFLTATAWVFFVLDGVFLVLMLMTAYSPGQDAAGRGMASGLAFVAGLIMLALALGLSFSLRHDSVFGVAAAIALVALPILLLAAPVVEQAITWMRREREAAKHGRFADAQLALAAAAIRNRDVGHLRTVLAKRPDQTARDESGMTLLGYAVKRALEEPASLEGVRAILDAGADPDQLMTPDSPPTLLTIFLSDSSGSDELLKLFLDRGANPNTRDANGIPMLHRSKDRLVKLKLLLDHGAEMDDVSDAEYQHGWTAVMALVMDGAYDEALYLVQRGADVQYPAQDGTTLMTLLERQRASAALSDYKLPDSHHALLKAVTLHASR